MDDEAELAERLHQALDATLFLYIPFLIKTLDGRSFFEKRQDIGDGFAIHKNSKKEPADQCNRFLYHSTVFRSPSSKVTFGFHPSLRVPEESNA